MSQDIQDRLGPVDVVIVEFPAGTLEAAGFEALLDAAAIHGHGTRLVEDLKQIEYSYRDLIGMALALGRLVAREST